MSGNQKFVCGMRRFDKHRMDSNTSRPTFQKELQDRLQAREQQDHLLFTSSTPTNVSSLSLTSNTITNNITPDTTYTPWKTPTGFSQ
jgi:hypothetical protein